MNGILNIYKEQGYTSHDVVAKLRGILHQKKIGHTGTLDPDATGVLPVCLGKATKVCDLLTNKSKTYQAVLLLGQETDTQDTSGEILQTYPVLCNADEVRDVILSFQGEYDQIPPMYSALKVNGKKLCDLARQGVEVERKARRITIHEIVIEKIEMPRVTMRVHCSKGTYIRTLCHDIGKKLGCGGCMESLVRTQSGDFVIENAVRLAQVEAMVAEDRIAEVIYPVDYVFRDIPKAVIISRFEKLVYNGNPIARDFFVQEPTEQTIRVYDEADCFIGIYKWQTERNVYKSVKMFME